MIWFNNFRCWLAYKICPELRDEIKLLRNSNTKLVLKLTGDEKYIRGD